jgi:hypothetical protein
MNPAGHLGPKLFRLEEANALVPRLEEDLARMADLQKLLDSCRHELSVHQLMSNSGVSETNPDRRKLEALQKEAETLLSEMGGLQREFQRLGCVPKSFREGLIDFYALRGDRLVFLCWRRGEPEITHWHSLETGIRGRRPIDSFHTDAS